MASKEDLTAFREERARLEQLLRRNLRKINEEEKVILQLRLENEVLTQSIDHWTGTIAAAEASPCEDSAAGSGQ